jgi:hypothetical protein
LQQITQMVGKPELALFDLGGSADLKLGVGDDHRRYLEGAAHFGLGASPLPQRPSIECRPG